MNTRKRLTLATLIAVFILIAGCATSPTEEPAEMEMPEEGQVESAALVAATPAPTQAPTTSPAVVATLTQPDTSVFPSRPNRLIVKNAELKLLVRDTDVAIDLTTQVAADSAGYIISSRVWYEQRQGESYKYATITLGVPVDQFERAMRRLRGLALQVLDETAAGQDVTDEYVDLQSRLDNLKATRDRIRDFMAQAQTVEESLRVNDQLAAVEEQIEQVQGRMNYLFDRAAYSTLTVQISPELPPITPTPTPTPTPAPPWSPMQTVEQAGHALGSILRVLTEVAIWLIIVVAPLLAPPVLIIWSILRWGRRQAKGSES